MFKLSTASLHVLVSATLSALACVAGATPCLAQATAVRVDVPFAFQAGQHHFKPGVYLFARDTNYPFMRILGTSQSGQAMFVPDLTLEPATTSKVVFHRYGSEYFLREVWMANSTSHVHTLPSKAEKQLQLAANSAFPAAATGEVLAVNQAPQ